MMRATPEQIIAKVSEYYKIPVKKIKGSSQETEICRARIVAMDLMRETGLSLKTIGKQFHRSHSTANRGLSNIDDRMHKGINREVEFLRNALKPERDIHSECLNYVYGFCTCSNACGDGGIDVGRMGK